MIPRWSVYPALVVLGTAPFVALPDSGSTDPNRGVAAESRAAGVVHSEEQSQASSTVTRDSEHEQVVVLGIDGMDPEILAEVIENHPDRMPNFRWLIESGSGINSLETSIPPQSPVAWSNFITGLDPGGHGIFDFIHRDPETYGVLTSTTVSEPSDPLVHLPGKWIIPGGGASSSNRSGVSFWELLRQNGIPADIWRMPANFPVEPSLGLSFPGMMTPALDSAYGECSFFTTDPVQQVSLKASYRKVYLLEEIQGVINNQVSGPGNPFIDTHAVEKVEDSLIKVPFKIYVDREAGSVAIEMDGGRTVVLEPGQWSDFVEVTYKPLPMGLQSMDGIARFYLRGLDPDVELYMSPVNLSPLNPPAPVSEPASASAELAEAIGLYYTQGMAEDVNALKGNILTDGEFMAQVDLVYTERRRMMDYAIDTYMEGDEGGLLFFYYSTVDLSCHMMWRHTDPVHPAHDPEVAGEDSSWWSQREGTTWKDVVTDLYLRMDPVLGRLRERLGDDVTYIVMSDHGFAPYRRKFDLNRWLYDNGYLVLKEDKLPEQEARPSKADRAMLVSHVDWSKTQAYGLGFNGLYLNMLGREGQGIVDPAEAAALLRKIKAELEATIDPKDPDANPILVCDIASEVYLGARVDEAPDIQVGYNVGYGNSDAASLGRITHAVFSDNTGGTFNGSHLMAPEVVSGILISNRPVLEGAHALEDLTVEILRRYDVAPTEGMRGTRVLAD
ncbi:MAG: putative AlkP superfamily phosphohydrolase/phosphomutase [Planctomycetota bacterium]|jgi:predicted AlkP superfamily phosphohydrolase/phosphomutase